MYQAIFQEKIQRPIDGRWRGAAAVGLAQHGQDVVGAQRLVAVPDQFQYAFAQGGQAQTLTRADAFCFSQGVADAV